MGGIVIDATFLIIKTADCFQPQSCIMQHASFARSHTRKQPTAEGHMHIAPGNLPVGHEACSAANTEEAVGDEAGAVVARVIVVGDVLVSHNQCALVRQRL